MQKLMMMMMSSEETGVRRKGSRKRRDDSVAWRSQSSSSPPPSPCVTEKETVVKGNNNINHNSDNEIHVLMSSDAQYCYYMLEAMPQPGPTWSTPGPCVLPEPTPPFEATRDSSCTWWLRCLQGFHENLTIEKLDPPFQENAVMENRKGFGCESPLVDAIDLSYCCPDDWLVIPTMDQDVGDWLIP
ncbi:hypothetical protein LR48_Vigan03g075700 [Vigna angularis]|uniref:Uncharacterized protein n=1 Tax=Phaseolus angularis TaxID=3914 RepID=A0A0L9U3K7_PHAAN|nr:uncharacterized protein HKW66_Vig0114900 [Vigna angularis]KOM37375.1 hypothetical protein LR48_Vigan03g075700 [Vigna angularis]